MKLERSNPGGSIKDRIGLSMIEDAERRGILKPESVIIEPTSGNTGIGLAMVAAVKKYKLILVMPDSMSIERRRLMTAYGAQLELTPREKGMKGAIERATELAAATKNSWIPQQFENEANVEIHRTTTAKEILNDFPEGFDMLITGVGTGRTHYGSFPGPEETISSPQGIRRGTCPLRRHQRWQAGTSSAARTWRRVHTEEPRYQRVGWHHPDNEGRGV